MAPRSVPEWVGATSDAKVPDHVRLRVFRSHDGRCHISGRKIRPADEWELEHVIPLALGGEHREANLAPALKDKHKAKSAREMHDKARSDRAAKRHLGIGRARGKLRSAGFPKTEPQRTASTPHHKHIGEFDDPWRRIDLRQTSSHPETMQKANVDRLDLSGRIVSAWEQMGGPGGTPTELLRMISNEVEMLQQLRREDPERVVELIERYEALAQALRTKIA